MRTETFTVDTGRTASIVDITMRASAFVDGSDHGLLNVFVPHATAGVAIIEVGSGSDDDLLDSIGRLLPRDDSRYRHRHGSPGHGADHVLPAWIAPSVVVPVVGGRMQLGTWQSIVVVDPNGDNPRRTVILTLIEDG